MPINIPAPECEKMIEVAPASRAIDEFIEWLRNNDMDIVKRATPDDITKGIASYDCEL